MKNRLNSVYLRTANKITFISALRRKSHTKSWEAMKSPWTVLSHAQLCKYGLILEQEINYLMEIALKKISFLPFGKYFYFIKKINVINI